MKIKALMELINKHYQFDPKKNSYKERHCCSSIFSCRSDNQKIIMALNQLKARYDSNPASEDDIPFAECTDMAIFL